MGVDLVINGIKYADFSTMKESGAVGGRVATASFAWPESQKR